MTNLEKQLLELQKKVNGEISLVEAFNDSFIVKHTKSKFTSTKDFFSNSSLQIKNQKDLDDISNDTINTFIKENTDFNNWTEMIKAGVIPIVQDRVKGNTHKPNKSNADEFLNIVVDSNITLA